MNNETKRKEEEQKLSEVLEINEKINISQFFKKRNMSAYNLKSDFKNEENSSQTFKQTEGQVINENCYKK